MKSNLKSVSIPAVMLLFLAACSGGEKISRSITLKSGSVNGVEINRNGKKLVVYGDPSGKDTKAEMILFTDFRRDVVWAGKKIVRNGALALAPAAERQYFSSGDSILRAYWQGRFHDYYCQTTKIPSEPVAISRFVNDGDTIKWHDIAFRVLDASGYTRGAVAYIADIDGKRIAFTGNMILAGGKLPDLYSFQDSFHQIRGYHGYATRLVKLVPNLEALAALKPDIIIPVRGAVITDPSEAISNLISRIKALYANYLSVSAYRWYYPDQVKDIADSLPGKDYNTGWMPYSSVIRKDPPEWYIHIGNTNLVMSDDSTGFLIDCGSREAFDELVRMKHSGRLKGIDGMFITHYHDDHTDLINDVVREFGCPVSVTGNLRDIMEHPFAYHLPCLTSNPARDLSLMDDGQWVRWKDFKLTYRFFPGQTLFHDALLFEKHNGESIFFIGDSFTPSGIDDYCLLNRNILHPGTGYFKCLDILKTLPDGVLLSNQHVEPLFAFSKDELAHMNEVLVQRVSIMKELLPFDDINYGIDEQWISVYPYGQSLKAGEDTEFLVRIYNHSPVERTFNVTPDKAGGLDIKPEKASITIAPQSQLGCKFRLTADRKTNPGIRILTVSVSSEDFDLHEWSEGLLEIK